MITFWVLTLFVCPDNVLKCTPFEMYPGKTQVMGGSYIQCINEGDYQRKINDFYVGFKCTKHEK
jgi:hypothetical protein